MPYPRGKEKKKNFISRCMSNSETNKKYPKQSQRYAVCTSFWKTSKGKNK